MTIEPSPPVLSEYADNPFIARLPPLVPQKVLYSALEAAPLFDEKERHYPAYLRKHCVARLANCFLPQARQIDLADRFGMLLRQGYLGRNPLTQDYLYRLHNGLDRIQARSLEAQVRHPVHNTASSFALLGCPGVGKTLAMNRVLAQYAQVIQHDAPFSLTQIVWLRLEAPALGSLRQLCVDFFTAIDGLIGTDYVKRYVAGANVEQMLANMAHVAQLHALGALIIDEIQHLKGVKVGADALLKFMVRLVNTIGVPVIPIGTLGALSILQGSFSQARRSTGLGSLLWDRMAADTAWDHFLKRLWTYQWTNAPTVLTPELSTVLYDESQGVADLAVKLFLLAQLRIVSASEFRKHQSEQLTERLFREVAMEEFGMVKPMIEALRQNDKVKIGAFEDLRPLNDHVRSILSDAMVSSGSPLPAPVVMPVPTTSAPQASMESMLIDTLSGMGVAPDVAQVLVRESAAKTSSGDPLQWLQQLVAALTATQPKRTKPKLKPQAADEMPTDDLRRLVGEGGKAGKSGYDALLAAGVVRPPMLDFAA